MRPKGVDADPPDDGRSALALGMPAGAVSQEQARLASGPPSPTQAAPGEAAADEPAQAPSQAPGSEFKWSWGNTISYGLGFRLSDPDQRLIGLAAGGTAFSVNGDDGIQNYEKGIFTPSSARPSSS